MNPQNIKLFGGKNGEFAACFQNAANTVAAHIYIYIYMGGRGAGVQQHFCRAYRAPGC